MRIVKIVALLALSAGLLAAVPASAHGGRFSIGIGIGSPWGWGPYPYYYGGPRYYYGDPYYYGGPPVVVNPAPATYIERQEVQPAAPAPSTSTAPGPNPAGYWYYCREPAGYYPTVSQCPSPWERVAPR